MIKDRASYMDQPGMRDTIEKTWRPLWKGMGVAQVASDLMVGRGPAVDDSAWGGPKHNEARIWVEEQLASRAKSERLSDLRSWAALVVSIAAVCVALAK